MTVLTVLCDSHNVLYILIVISNLVGLIEINFANSVDNCFFVCLCVHVECETIT